MVETVSVGTGHFLFAFLSFLCFSLGLTGSVFSLLYFLDKYRKKQSSSTLLFIFMNVTDGMICFLTLFVGISDVAGRKPVLFANAVFCDVWGVLWYVCARMSIFLLGFLSISRTYMVMYPLAQIAQRKILAPVIVYATLMIIQQTFSFWFGVRYSYESGHCAVDAFVIFSNGIAEQADLTAQQITVTTKIFFFILVPLENIFPWVLIVVSCVLTVFSIKQSRFDDPKTQDSQNCCNFFICCRRAARTFRRRNDNSLSSDTTKEPKDNKRTATINIVILTLVYLTFNTFSITVFTLDTIEIFSNERIQIYSSLEENTLNIILLLAWIHSISLNSACNVVVYFWRIRNLREYTVGLLRGKKIPELKRNETFCVQQLCQQQRNALLQPSVITIL